MRIRLLILLFIVLFSASKSEIYSQQQETNLTVSVDKCYHDYKIEDDPEGHRKPSKPLLISISIDNGIYIPGIDNQDIISYSIYDEYSSCLFTSEDEYSFIEYLFSNTGTFEINIDTNEFSLKGWIQIN